jgi:hypothetical protein
MESNLTTSTKESHHNNQTIFYLFNQTKKWLPLTTTYPTQPNKKMAIPNQVVGDTLIP